MKCKVGKTLMALRFPGERITSYNEPRQQHMITEFSRAPRLDPDIIEVSTFSKAVRYFSFAKFEYIIVCNVPEDTISVLASLKAGDLDKVKK